MFAKRIASITDANKKLAKRASEHRQSAEKARGEVERLKAACCEDEAKHGNAMAGLKAMFSRGSDTKAVLSRVYKSDPSTGPEAYREQAIAIGEAVAAEHERVAAELDFAVTRNNDRIVALEAAALRCEAGKLAARLEEIAEQSEKLSARANTAFERFSVRPSPGIPCSPLVVKLLTTAIGGGCCDPTQNVGGGNRLNRAATSVALFRAAGLATDKLDELFDAEDLARITEAAQRTYRHLIEPTTVENVEAEVAA